MDDWDDTIRRQEQRKIKRQDEGPRAAVFGLGLFGMVGWTVATPLVLMTMLGHWIDRTWPSPYSWTLMLLGAGLMIGCANAWAWVERERRGRP